MKLILTGVTGAAGSQIFQSALNDTSISHITVLSRRALPAWLPQTPQAQAATQTAAPTVDTVILEDFLHYPPEVAAKLREHDAVVWALGKSAAGIPEDAYEKMTYGYTMAAVEALKGSPTKPFPFVFISGEGADPSGKSMMMWARVKGKTEKALIDAPHIRASVLRSGYFFPSSAQPALRENTRGAWARRADVVLGPVFKTLTPSMYTPVEGLAHVALGCAKGAFGTEGEGILRNTKIRELMKK